MDDGGNSIGLTENIYTLLGVRQDGIASVVDLIAGELAGARSRARTLLQEHASCVAVEVWRDGALLEELERVAS